MFFPRRLADPDAARRRLYLSGDVESNPGPRQHQSAPRQKGSLRVLQLNLNGWRSRRHAVTQALSDWKVDVAVFQETNLQPKDEVKVPGFTTYRRDRTIHRGRGPTPHGGIMICIRDGIIHDPATPDLPNLPAGAALEALQIMVHPPKSRPLNITNIYRPPGRSAQDDDRDTSPHHQCWPADARSFILGDVNGHGSWDQDKEADEVGDAVEDFLATNGWNYLNNGPTRIAPDGSPSAPDISITHASWSSKVTWTTMATVGSDHLPILLEIEVGPPAPPKQEARASEVQLPEGGLGAVRPGNITAVRGLVCFQLPELRAGRRGLHETHH